MKIALAQLSYHIGNFEQNTESMIRVLHEMKEQNVDLVVFAELAISGYPPRDFLEFSDFIDRCYDSIDKIANHCIDIAAIVGGPARNNFTKGKKLSNAAFFLSDGKVKDVIYKSLLPTYDIFDEYRYFEPNTEFRLIELKNEKIALTICEDLWNIDDNPMYKTNPMDELIKLQPDFMVNIAASPFHSHQAFVREDVLRKNVKRYSIPLIYVNHVGAQTELLFDGGSMVINSKAEVTDKLEFFKEEIRIIDTQFIENEREERNEKPIQISLIHDALVMGIRQYFKKLGFKKAILGLSGGIDSAVVAVLATEALGNENVHVLLLPSEFSSDHSIKDAEDLAKTLNISYDIIPIKNSFQAVTNSLEPFFKDLPFNIAEENLQARLRAILLMGFSNKFGHILLNTSNKSEAAVGYGTLYGDMCGGLSVIGDVYKTQVFELAKYINRKKEIIPINTILKPPSAELRPNQKDSDSLPDYEILDKILFHYIEERMGPQEIVEMGYDEKTVQRILKLVNINEHKRHQTPPILRVSSKAFGQGRRMPIVAKYLS